MVSYDYALQSPISIAVNHKNVNSNSKLHNYVSEIQPDMNTAEILNSSIMSANSRRQKTSIISQSLKSKSQAKRHSKLSYGVIHHNNANNNTSSDIVTMLADSSLMDVASGVGYSRQEISTSFGGGRLDTGRAGEETSISRLLGK